MELILLRKYYPSGTNGEWMTADGKSICYNIELPWLKNVNKLSCIPEFRYQLERIVSPAHGDCLTVRRVLNRSGILIHPANNALKELMGCLAPVTAITGLGKGSGSRLAVAELEAIVFPELAKGSPVWVTIKNAKGKPYELFS